MLAVPMKAAKTGATNIAAVAIAAQEAEVADAVVVAAVVAEADRGATDRLLPAGSAPSPKMIPFGFACGQISDAGCAGHPGAALPIVG